MRSHGGEVVLTLVPRPAVYTIHLDPPESALEVKGDGVTITGSGGTRTVEVARPREDRELALVGSLPGYEEDRQLVKTRPGEPKQLTVRPKLKPATVAIEVEPPGATETASAGARVVGEGNHRQLVVDVPVPRSTVKVVVTHAGYVPATRTWSVGQGQTLSVGLQAVGAEPVPLPPTTTTTTAVRRYYIIRRR